MNVQQLQALNLALSVLRDANIQATVVQMYGASQTDMIIALPGIKVEEYKEKEDKIGGKLNDGQ